MQSESCQNNGDKKFKAGLNQAKICKTSSAKVSTNLLKGEGAKLGRLLDECFSTASFFVPLLIWKCHPVVIKLPLPQHPCQAFQHQLRVTVTNCFSSLSSSSSSPRDFRWQHSGSAKLDWYWLTDWLIVWRPILLLWARTTELQTMSLEPQTVWLCPNSDINKIKSQTLFTTDKWPPTMWVYYGKEKNVLSLLRLICRGWENNI